ncbi:hypothetical protein MNBD_DELTA04-938 [hydrothermal vent metagenome]|uniref:Uncharacterized protein n=1 Tax=hydrothermal vent metagenome TaxID=652676 RepID=A0A3B0VBM8_9ZZZZ
MVFPKPSRLAYLPDPGIILKKQSSEYHLYTCGYFFRLSRSLPLVADLTSNKKLRFRTDTGLVECIGWLSFYHAAGRRSNPS